MDELHQPEGVDVSTEVSRDSECAQWPVHAEAFWGRQGAAGRAVAPLY